MGRPIDEAASSHGEISIYRAKSLLIPRGLFFFGQFVVPNIVAQTQFRFKRFGLSNADFAAFVQELLNKGIIRCFFGDMFHRNTLTVSVSFLSRVNLRMMHVGS